MPEWIGNPVYIFLWCAGWFVAFSIWLRYFAGTSTTFWRTVGVVTILLGGVGLVSVSLESFKAASFWRLQDAQRQSVMLGSSLVNNLEIPVSSACVPGERGEIVVENFDEIEDERRQVCHWAQQFLADLTKLDFNLAPLIEEVQPPTVKFGPLVQDVDAVQTALTEYSTQRNSTIELEKMADRDSTATRALAAFAPYLLSLAFALALAKELFKP